MGETFIFQDIEVRLTGRRARRDTPNGTEAKSVMVEITPINECDGTWKKWVFATVLFRIYHHDAED